MITHQIKIIKILKGKLGSFVGYPVDDFFCVFDDRRFDLRRNRNDFSVGVNGVDEPVCRRAFVVLDTVDGLDAGADTQSFSFESETKTNISLVNENKNGR